MPLCSLIFLETDRISGATAAPVMERVRVVPETSRIAVGWIFIGLAVVIGAFITIILAKN